MENRAQKLLAIHCMPDHTHLFVGFKPTLVLSDLVRDVKTASSSFIKQQKWATADFAWQQGFGAFTYAQSQVTTVVDYILKQEEHHRKQSFQQEYLKFLEKFKLEYQRKHLFEWYDNR